MSSKKLSPINLYKFSPLTGNRFEKKSDNLLVDSETGFRFYISPKPTVNALIFDKKDRLLFTKRAIDPEKGMLDLPGGFVDLNETLEEALMREIKEELNGKVKSLKYFDSFVSRYFYQGVNYQVLDISFVCKLKNLNNLEPKDDVGEIMFLAKNEFKLDDIAFVSIKQAVSKFLGK